MEGGLFGHFHRVPPENVAAEQALLGAVLTNSEKVLPQVVETLRPEHFAYEAHGRLYAECLRLFGLGRTADPLMLKGWYEATFPEDAQNVGRFFADLVASMIGLISCNSYAEAIIDCWRRRRAIELANEISAAAYNTPSEFLDDLVPAIHALDELHIATSRRPAAVISDSYSAAIEAGERARKCGGALGLSTGLPSLDAALGGLEGGGLYLLAGRPGSGKSALGLQIAMANARDGIPTGYCSLEMQNSQLGRRALSMHAGVPQSVLRRGDWDRWQAEKIVKAQHEIAGVPLIIDDEGGLTADAISARAKAMRRKHGLKLLVVDHLHIVATPKNTEKMGATWGVEQVSGAMKRLAKDLDIPVLALAQLSRAVESREDKRPTMSDLRQSGSLEQDAEAIMMLYRAEYYLAKSPPEKGEKQSDQAHQKAVQDWHDACDRLKGKAEVILTKVRDGEPTSVNLKFDSTRVCFEEP